jgi:hypothetical protein
MSVFAGDVQETFSNKWTQYIQRNKSTLLSSEESRFDYLKIGMSLVVMAWLWSYGASWSIEIMIIILTLNTRDTIVDILSRRYS